jgi:hypothetical protein
LSSKDLKLAEICVLSKGLNFCPLPNKINEELSMMLLAEQHMPLLTMLRNSVENKLPLYQPFMIKKFVEI